MHKIVLLSVFISALIFSCNDSTVAGKTDSANGNKKGLSVSDPLAPQPHKVNDTIFNGDYIDRYENGVIYMKGEVSGGVRVGEWITFYRSGKEWSRGIYVNGLRQGHGVSYYESGQKSSEGEYKDDKMIGKWQFWDENGNVVEKDFGGK
jgi:hypothetical protein